MDFYDLLSSPCRAEIRKNLDADQYADQGSIKESKFNFNLSLCLSITPSSSFSVCSVIFFFIILLFSFSSFSPLIVLPLFLFLAVSSLLSLLFLYPILSTSTLFPPIFCACFFRSLFLSHSLISIFHVFPSIFSPLYTFPYIPFFLCLMHPRLSFFISYLPFPLPPSSLLLLPFSITFPFTSFLISLPRSIPFSLLPLLFSFFSPSS